MKDKLKDIVAVFFLFMKTGAVTFGGGYAMLPILQRELVEKRSWVTDEELADYYAIGQCTPGIIALNVSTFIGRKRAGAAGAVAAAIGFELIPMILITVISVFLQGFSDNEYVKHALAGIRVSVCVLILNTIVKLWKSSIKDIPAFCIFLVIFLVSALADFLPFDIPPAVFVLLAALAGILIKQIAGRKKA